MCASVCVREHLRDRGFDLNSSLTHCGAAQECTDLEYAYKFWTAAADLLTLKYLSDQHSVHSFALKPETVTVYKIVFLIL